MALWKPLSRRSKRWASLTFWYTSVTKSEAAYIIRRLTSRCLERKPSRVGVSPLCDVVSSFLCHTHTDGKDKLLEWPDRSCLVLYVSATTHIHTHTHTHTWSPLRFRRALSKNTGLYQLVGPHETVACNLSLHWLCCRCEAGQQHVMNCMEMCRY